MSTESKDSLQSKAVLTILDLLGEGEIGGLVDGMKSVYLDDTPIQNEDGTFNFQGVTGISTNGTNTQAPLPNFGNFSEAPFNIGVQVKKATPYTFTISNPVTDAVRVIMSFPSLSSTDSGNGDISGTTVSYKFSRSVNNGAFTDVDAATEWIDAGTIGSSASPLARTATASGSLGLRATLKLTANQTATLVGEPGSINVQAQELNGSTWTDLGAVKTLAAEWAVTTIPAVGEGGDVSIYSLVTDPYTVESQFAQVRFLILSSEANFDVAIESVRSRTLVSVCTVTGKSRSRYQRAHVLPVPQGASTVRFRVTRITDDSTTSYLTNETWLDSYSEIVTQNMAYPNSALFGFRADSQQFSKIPSRSYLVDGLMIQVPVNYNPVTRVYTGVWNGLFKRVVSNNPAWVLYDILTNNRYGLGNFISAAQVDKAALYTIGKYCDEMVPDGFGGTGPRFTLNTVISSQGEAFKLISDITSVFRGMGYWDGGMVKFTQDAPSDPVMLFTQANVVDGSFSYTGSARKDRHSVVHVTWNDPSNNYKSKIEYVEDGALISKYGVKKLDTLAFGCTSRAEAARVGRWILYTERYESDFIIFKVGIDAALVSPGDIIKISDSMRAGKRAGGRLTASTLTSATVDSPVVISATPATVSLMQPNGTFAERTLTNGVGTHTVLNWATALPALPVNNAIYMLSEPVLVPVKARVISINQDGNSPTTFEITAVETNPSKYGFIESGLSLEDGDPSLFDPSFRDAPTNITITETVYETAPGVAATKLIVSWFGNSTKYEVSWRATSASNTSNWQTQIVDGLTFEALNVTAGTYEFSIVGINPLGVRSRAVTASYIVQGALLPRPVLTLTATGQFRSVLLEWTSAASAITSHWELWHGDTDVLASALKVADIASPTSSYTHTGLAPNSTHHYWMRTISVTGDASDFFPATGSVSALVPAIPILDAPTGILTSQAIDYVYKQPMLTIGISWNAISLELAPYFSGYGVSYSSDNGASWIEVEVATNGWNMTNAIPGRAYKFRIRTKNTDGVYGPYSAIVTYTATGDLTPPSAPTSLSAVAGTNFIRLSWTASPETDTAGYEVFYSTGTSSAAAISAGKTDLAALVVGGLTAGTAYNFWVKAYDTSQNFSAFSAMAAATTLADATEPTPNAIIGLSLTQATQTESDGLVLPTLFAAWVADGSAAYYEVSIKEGAGNYVTFLTAENSYNLRGLKAGVTYTVRVRAFNSSGQAGGYSNISTLAMTGDAVAPATPTGLTAVASLRNVYLSWTAPSATDVASIRIFTNTVNDTATATILAHVNAKPSQSGGYTHSGLSPATTYYYWLRAVDASGNTSALSSAVSATTIQAANADLAAGAVTADKITANTITGDRINTATSLPGTITVGTTGVSIGTVQTQADDPAARVNAKTTTIDPGKILISGATTLANWRSGTDATKIDGGNIAANTISANQLSVGLRGLNITGLEFSYNKTTNVVSWTAGTIEYVNDLGVSTTQAIALGSATWTTGIIYIYWDQASGTTLQTTVTRATAYGPTKFVVGTYAGGIKLIVNYGRTLIDGDQIITGTVKAQSLETNVLSASNIKSGTIETALVYIGKDASSVNHLALDGPNERITVNDGTRDRVKLGKLGTGNYGLELLDAAGNVILSNDGRLGSTLFIGSSGTQTLGELATNAAVPAINFVGNFATAPAVASYTKNAVYKNTTDGNSYVLTGSPLAWEPYLTSGANGTSFWLTSSTGIIKASADGVMTPSTITFSAFAGSGTTAIAYNGRFVVATTLDGTNYTTAYTSTVNQSSYTFTVPGFVQGVRVRLYTAGGTTTLVDEEVILTIDSTPNAVSASLTNGSHILAADSLGAVSSFVGADTTMTTYVGGAIDSSNWAFYVSAVSGTTTYRDSNDTADRSATGYVDGHLGGTNLFLQSNAFTNAAWTKLNVTPTIDNSVAMPLGVPGQAHLLSETTANGAHYIEQAATAPASSTHAVTWLVKDKNRGFIRFETLSNPTSTTFANTVFDLTNGTFSQDSLGGGAVFAAKEVEKLTNGWWLVVLYVTLGGANTSIKGRASLHTGTLSSYTGVASVGVYLLGAQLEAAAYATGGRATGYAATTTTARAGTPGYLKVTTLTTSSAYFDITAARPGYPLITQRFSVSKSTQGAQGVDGVDGVDGVRGSKTFYRSVASATWSNTEADTAITSQGLTKVLNDQVTLYTSAWAQTRFWNGSAWTTITVAIDGNLLVTGTVSGDKLVANSVTANKINGQNLVVYAGGYSSTYTWPAAGLSGFHLSSSGLLIGNYNNGKYFQVTAQGDVQAPGFSIIGGAATFSGSLSAASGTFSGSLSAAGGTFSGVVTGVLMKILPVPIYSPSMAYLIDFGVGYDNGQGPYYFAGDTANTPWYLVWAGTMPAPESIAHRIAGVVTVKAENLDGGQSRDLVVMPVVNYSRSGTTINGEQISYGTQSNGYNMTVSVAGSTAGTYGSAVTVAILVSGYRAHNRVDQVSGLFWGVR